jgi:hypothetical protein
VSLLILLVQVIFPVVIISNMKVYVMTEQAEDRNTSAKGTIALDDEFIKALENAFSTAAEQDTRFPNLAELCMERLRALNVVRLPRTSFADCSSRGISLLQWVGSICAELCELFVQHKINAWTFANLSEYIPHLNFESRVVLNPSVGVTARRPSILLRTATSRTAPIFAWPFGEWGWEAVLGNICVDFDALQAGQLGVSTVGEYIAKIDSLAAIERPKGHPSSPNGDNIGTSERNSMSDERRLLSDPLFNYYLASQSLPKWLFYGRYEFIETMENMCGLGIAVLIGRTAVDYRPPDVNVGLDKLKPDSPILNEFGPLTGSLGEGANYVVIKFPTPPPAVMRGTIPVMGPYFSAIVYCRELDAIDYYVLRQSAPGVPFATNLRKVLSNGDSLNLGSYGLLDSEKFIALLKHIQENGVPVYGGT